MGRNVSMKLLKYGIVCGALCMLICVSFTASALNFSDPKADVNYSNGSDDYGEVRNKPNIDISQLAYIVKGNYVTLSLTVVGDIQISKNVVYMAYINSTDTQYSMLFNNENIIGQSMNRISRVCEYANGSVLVTGDTLSAVFNLRGNASMVEIDGLAEEGNFTESGPTGDLWMDEARFTYPTPTNNTSENNTNGNTGTSPGKKTPGFELLPVIAAVTITAILLRRRR